MPYQPQFQQRDVHVLSKHALHEGFWRVHQLRLNHALFSGGLSAPMVRELCIRQDAVAVLLYDPKHQRIALVEQFRVGMIGRKQSPWLLELVAGMMDKTGEDVEAVARRETHEEAGLVIEDLEHVCEYYVSPGGSCERLTVLCGKVNLRDVNGGLFGVAQEHEDIRLHVLPVQEVMTLLNQGVINNAMTIIALQWLQLHAERLNRQWR